jgi:DNA-binding XRE family transcriptional regulator
MKGLRNIPRILKINAVEGTTISLLFNNGESRTVDFVHLLQQVLQKKPGQLGYQLLEDAALFANVKLVGTTIGWEEIGRESKDFSGNVTFHPYDLDPLLLFNNSEPDEERNVALGTTIRQARLAAGLTQAELAQRSGTTKHSISRIENNRTDVELMTLRKIVEAGLGKRLTVEIV